MTRRTTRKKTMRWISGHHQNQEASEMGVVRCDLNVILDAVPKEREQSLGQCGDGDSRKDWGNERRFRYNPRNHMMDALNATIPPCFFHHTCNDCLCKCLHPRTRPCAHRI